MKEIIWRPKARKQLKKINEPHAIALIVDAVGKLASFPDTEGVKALVNHRYSHRLRVGNYRVLFNAFSDVEIISVEEVKKRNERTYK